MFRTIGFLIGFSLASLGLLFLIDASSALRTRDAAAQLIRRIDIALPQEFVFTRTRHTEASAPRASSTDTPIPVEVETPQLTVPDDAHDIPQLPQEEQHLRAMTESIEAPAAPPVSGQSGDELESAPRVNLEETTARHWYVFWSPFRTEYAASGFAERLTHLTGLNFTVIKEGPGEYQVAFAYADEVERSAGLAMIETETGLRLRPLEP